MRVRGQLSPMRIDVLRVAGAASLMNTYTLACRPHAALINASPRRAAGVLVRAEVPWYCVDPTGGGGGWKPGVQLGKACWLRWWLGERRNAQRPTNAKRDP